MLKITVLQWPRRFCRTESSIYTSSDLSPISLFFITWLTLTNLLSLSSSISCHPMTFALACFSLCLIFPSIFSWLAFSTYFVLLEYHMNKAITICTICKEKSNSVFPLFISLFSTILNHNWSARNGPYFFLLTPKLIVVSSHCSNTLKSSLLAMGPCLCPPIQNNEDWAVYKEQVYILR